MVIRRLSPNYCVVIPSEIRKKLKLHAGQKITIMEKDGIIRIIPIKPLREARGFLKDKGITTENLREEATAY